MRRFETILILDLCLFIILSTITLRSVAPYIYPQYFIYILIAVFVFIVFRKIDFDIYKLFSAHFYVLSIILLILPLIIGQVTRGAIRWIPLGGLSIQPSEIVRAFLLLYFAKYFVEGRINIAHIAKLFLIFIIPVLLILIQPSLGVAVITVVGFFGVSLASQMEKKYLLITILIFILIMPMFWLILAPYQKQRVLTFLNPENDPLGSGYNSIQSMITVGSGGFFGRGLGEGVQTQLKFLPERHTDFIFASITEEMGYFGGLLLIFAYFIFFYLLIEIIKNAKDPVARAYSTGVFMVLFTEFFIHLGMNMGLLPITGIPLPFVSAGGSSLIGTVMMIAIALNSKKVT
ncbi:MAG: Rod shape-determining protein RodA [Candidatus Woesebacteria bacterium GW2011_GWA1_37_7]|uniref:Probable peptidoglycan glycosyltransferase FtsW n=1 Tax=Candidatus Woesebacteria bacterium GW2011_GWA1_37_7 TaxID=1618545 RepID=A0A0G0H6D7_9BACT|nr:MAG: Rod shape-determining protein RodA [Candidatus Woesebacteria bacterium GW2011_GWA1_37_7]